MPFTPVFEKHVNEDMQESQAGPAPRSPPSPCSSGSTAWDDSDIKKRPLSPKRDDGPEAEDLDMSYKRQKSLPPRFSTIFDTGKSAQPLPAQPSTPRIVECCHRESGKKGGIHLSTPAFVFLVIVLLFESTLLFAYTVIGLYQNTPLAFLGAVGVPTPVDGCHCGSAAADSKQSAINFAPKFVFGQPGAQMSVSDPSSVTPHETSTATSPITATSVSEATSTESETSTTDHETDHETETSTTATSTTATTTTTDAAKLAASQVLGVLKGAEESEASSLRPERSTVRATTVVTSSVGFSTSPIPTVTSIVEAKSLATITSETVVTASPLPA